MNRAVFYGLISGVVVSSISVFMFFANLKPSTMLLVLQFAPMVASIICIFLSVNWTKHHAPEFSFKTALKAGVITSAVSTILYGITSIFLLKATDPQKLISNTYQYIELLQTEIKVPPDSAGKATMLTKAIVSGDSAFDARDNRQAIDEYSKALKIDSLNTHVNSKLRDMVNIEKSRYLEIGNIIGDLIWKVVIYVLIGGVIAAISFFLIRQR